MDLVSVVRILGATRTRLSQTGAGCFLKIHSVSDTTGKNKLHSGYN